MSKFHQDNSFVRALMGPIGSGKSVACVMEILMRAVAQAPDKEGVRRSRWVIIRNSYRELLDTSVKTFHQWIPEELGETSIVNATFFLPLQLEDGTSVELEVLFRALDKPGDLGKLLSLELTGGFINEAKNVPKQVFDMLQGRVGRYPSAAQGGPSWSGVILDTNPPDTDHWFYELFETLKPEGHKLYHQPSALSPEAENLKNLPTNYYTRMILGKTKEWIKVWVEGKYGFVSDDNPVFPQYNDDIHYVDEEFQPLQSKPIYIGIDFGLTPAMVFGQLNAAGGMDIFDELQTFNMAAKEFGRIAFLHMQTVYRGFKFEAYGDPAGNQRAQTDEVTPFMILAEQGINASPTYTNDPDIRIEVIASYLRQLDFTGKPAFRIWKKAPGFRKAMAGGYKYKRVQVGGEERFKNEPDKNKHSHIADAAQYLFLGAVGESAVTGGFSSDQINYNNTGIV